MAEVPQLDRIAVVGSVDAHGGHSRRRHPSPRPRPEARTERAIRDAASVMGIPRAELTPKVLEALTLILHEMDRIRWDLEVSRERESYLERLSDVHAFLPVLNRRAFVREIGKMAHHAIATETPSTLIYLDVTNLDEIKRQSGISARDDILRQITNFLVHGLREIDLIAELGGGDFGIILNIADEQAARDKAGKFANHLRSEQFEFDAKHFKLEIDWGVCALNDPSLEVANSIATAERRSRRRH